MKIYGCADEDWGGWKESEAYPWYELNFIDTQQVRDIILSKVSHDEKFSYIRIGDGPLGYIDDLTHRWHPKDEKIKSSFIETFRKIEKFNEDDFMAGIPFDTPQMSGGLISSIKVQHQCWNVVNKYFPKHRKYFAHNAPHWMLCCDLPSFVNFTEMISQKNVCVVGNEKFPAEVLKFLYGDRVSHIKVPYVNAFYSHQDLTRQVLESNDDIFLFAASFATYPVMVDVYEKIGNQKTMIDIGSTIDPFVNYFANVRNYAVTHSGKRGWWMSDYPDIAENYVKMRTNRAS